jgi:hypothetical protein
MVLEALPSADAEGKEHLQNVKGFTWREAVGQALAFFPNWKVLAQNFECERVRDRSCELVLLRELILFGACAVP